MNTNILMNLNFNLPGKIVVIDLLLQVDNSGETAVGYWDSFGHPVREMS